MGRISLEVRLIFHSRISSRDNLLVIGFHQGKMLLEEVEEVNEMFKFPKNLQLVTMILAPGLEVPFQISKRKIKSYCQAYSPPLELEKLGVTVINLIKATFIIINKIVIIHQ